MFPTRQTITNDSSKKFLSELTSSRWLRCFTALTLVFLSSWLLNQYIFPRFIPVFGMAREIATVTSCATYLTVAVAASIQPALFHAKYFASVAASTVLVGFCLVAVGLMTANPIALSAGSILMSVGRGLVSVYSCIVLTEIGVFASALCVAGGLATAYLLHGVFFVMPPLAGAIIFAATPFTGLMLIHPYAQTILERLRKSQAASTLALTEPRSFLPFAHVLFIAFFVFRIAYGYSLTFGAVESTPPFTLLPLLPLIVVIAQVVIAKRAAPADILYVGACLFVLAGFLAVLVPQATNMSIPNMLLATGGDCFSVLMYYTLAAIGRRNPLQTLPIFAWGLCASGMGLLTGTSLGHLGNELLTNNFILLPATVATVIFLFMAYNLIALRSFSFEKTIAGVESVPQLTMAKNPDPSDGSGMQNGADFVDRQCVSLAEKFSLTERELDVFRLLAHGRNVPFIEEELIISRNTIKTHIKHLYQKMNLHSQQELIDMVETY